MSDDPLAGLTRRELEQARSRIDVALRSCIIDGREGAEPYLVSRHGTRASLMLCRPCFERARLPEQRAVEAT